MNVKIQTFPFALWHCVCWARLCAAFFTGGGRGQENCKKRTIYSVWDIYVDERLDARDDANGKLGRSIYNGTTLPVRCWRGGRQGGAVGR